MAINAQDFLEALESLETTRGISKQTILESLKEAMIKGYRKQLGGDDADVRVDIDAEKGTIEMGQVKKVVEEPEDDFLEISLEDARKTHKDINVGDDYFIPANIDDLKKTTALLVKSVLRQKFAEAEKEILYENFKDKIGTMITGKVEKIDERGASVNIGNTSVYMPRRAMIGDEVFMAGDAIKIFVSDVESGTRGARINVSRANEGFLKCLFVETIGDIYDGTIEIKAIARRAGERSKVAVYSNDPNVDPAGACIGPNGSKIQKIVSQLGNGTQKEKIDIIAWSENPSLFIMEALKPAQVVGIKLEDGSKSAIVVVKDDSFSLAIGRKGVNVNLAVRLTGYNIDIKTETQATEEAITYKTLDDIQAEEIAEKALRIAKAQTELNASLADGAVLPGLPDDYVAPQDRVYEDEEDEDINEALMEESEKEELAINEDIKEEVNEEVQEQEAKVEEPVQEVKVTNVETTTTIEDLEKSLEQDKDKNKGKTYSKRKKFKKDDEEETDDTVITPVVDPSNYMSIYTEEELAEMELEDEEDVEYDDEEIDYDEYDSYYDDDNQ